MGFGLRIAPGVRISASSRGVRAGIGPRAARVHVGSGRSGLSTGAGPLTYYTGGGQRRRPSVSSYEQQVRAAQRQEEIQAAADADRAMLTMCEVHREQFAPAGPWETSGPEPVDEKAISSQMTKEALQGISVLKRGQRKAAKGEVAPKIEAAINEERQRRTEAAATDQERLDRIWEQLQANDPETVMKVLEHAFEDNEAPAACVNCQGDRIDVVMSWPPVDSVVPERKFTYTPSGKPTHHKRNKTEKNELYLEALASNAMATVKEALAVAPKINDVGLLVFCKTVNGQRKTVEPLFAGLYDRAYIAWINWPEYGVAGDLISGSRANLNFKGQTKELAPIDLSDDPETRGVVEQVARSLGAEAPSLTRKPRRPRAAEDTKLCPECAETIKAAARKCRYCGYRFEGE